MKLAEMLIQRADLNKKILSIKERLEENAKVQEGEKSLENPSELLEEFFSTLKEYEACVKVISKTNFLTKVNNNESLLDLILKKEVLGKKHKTLTALYESATMKEERYRATEIKIIPNINGKKIQKMVSQCAKEYREVDTKIQAINWTTEVKELKP